MAYVDGIYHIYTGAIFSVEWRDDLPVSSAIDMVSDMLLLLIKAKFNTGAYACAVKYATQFLAIGSMNEGDNYTVLLLRARAYATMQEYGRALADYDEIARLLSRSEEYDSSFSWTDPANHEAILFVLGWYLKLKRELAEDPPAPLMAFAHLRLEMQVDGLLATEIPDPVYNHQLPDLDELANFPVGGKWQLGI